MPVLLVAGGPAMVSTVSRLQHQLFEIHNEVLSDLCFESSAIFPCSGIARPEIGSAADCDASEGIPEILTGSPLPGAVRCESQVL
jgi:hypothetical protein